MEEEEEGRHNVPPPQGQPIGPSVDDEEVGFAAAVAAAAEEEKKVPAPAAPSSTRPREVLATAESESNDPAADAANASNNNSSSNSNSSNNPDPDHVALVRDGLLCDEDTEAVLAEVEGTLHQDEAATTTTMTATEPSAHLDGSESSRKRKAEEEGLTGGGSRHVLHRHEGNNEDGIYGNLPHDPNDDENHGHSNDDDGFGDEGGGSDNHHRLHHQHHHHSLLDSNSAAAAAPYDPASGIGVGIDGGEGEAIAAAAAVAAAAAAAALTSTTSPSMGAPTARRALSAARKSAPPRVSWEDRIEQLRSYKAEHGDLLIPIRYRDNPSLGKFVHNTREQYKLFHKRAPANYKKKCSLTQERIEQLDQIGFVWATERSKKQDEDWNARLEQLREYKDAHGDCLVPHGYKVDPSFAEWVHRQRTTYAIHLKEGRVNPMVEGRMKKLEGMGFNFRVHVDKWTEHYEQLQEYRKQNGNCLVPTHFSTNMKLGRWVHTQRHQHRLMQRGRKSSMTEERAKLLEELGFSWEVRPGIDRLRVSWHERFLELKNFVQASGHFSVSPVTNAPLYAWCVEQLQRLQAMAEQPPPSADGVREPKVKGLGQDRVKSLADIGFTKDVKLAPVLCEAGAAALAAETAARELDGNSSHDEDDDHDHHEDDDEDSHRNEGDGDFNGSGKNVRKVAAVIPGGENSGVSVEV